MVELICADGPDDAGLVDDLREIGKKLTHPLAALTVLRETKLTRQNLRNSLDKGKPLSGQKRRRRILHMQLFKFRLVLEQFKLGG